MLYYLHELDRYFTPLNIFSYITFRTLCAAATAFIFSLLYAPGLIRRLRQFNIDEQKVDERVGALNKSGKVGTPTMGGFLIIISASISTMLWSELMNLQVVLTLLTFCIMGLIGFADDYLKIKRRNGLSVKAKFLAQVVWAAIIFSFLWQDDVLRQNVQELMVPFVKYPVLNMGLIGGFLFLFFVLVGASNAVNLTDGLDGLAIGCSNSVAGAYLVLTYVAGHRIFAEEHLFVPYVPGSGELTVFCGALLGAGMGFLWFNCHPAKIFMGDTGSLALGGAIAMIAILIKQELLLVIVGGVFVIEAASVMIQSSFFKYTRKRYGEGRRIFKCAPLHHHFEFVEKERAMDENRPPELVETVIVTRFWILSIIFALIGVATLKIR
ncbi:MAG: phospho-N-acetylmuramoyl-pentapeptide-transferase [Pontiellaceae bacterium]|nr:phospho-N-acetylmuramoyl-pentapeptide-transferase [Pontiellaceae bacterium]MBN2785207.1 phospho-N-acetylmuramoyl-pentapeptide-transferase [Pontiellaceae bacterium]